MKLKNLLKINLSQSDNFIIYVRTFNGGGLTDIVSFTENPLLLVIVSRYLKNVIEISSWFISVIKDKLPVAKDPMMVQKEGWVEKKKRKKSS